MIDLTEEYRKMALICYFAGMNCDDRPNGRIHRWVEQNVKHRPETAFFIVLGVNCELAKLTAKPQAPKHCKGQMRLFEPHNRLIQSDSRLVNNPKWGQLTD